MRNRFRANDANFSVTIMLCGVPLSRRSVVLKHSFIYRLMLAIAAGAMATPALSANGIVASDPLTYADLADLALPAKIVAKVQITETIALKAGPDSPPRADVERLYVSAQIADLLRGQVDTPRAVSFLDDVVRDARGKVPKLKNTIALVFGRPVPDRPNDLQLNAPDAAIAWSPMRESIVRAILVAAAAPDSPPTIRGVDSAFSVPGTIPGERETQIFLQTDSRPVSLVITRHANEAPNWTVALGEIVDHGVPPPVHDSLLWYQLACHLPPEVPAAKLVSVPDQAEAIRADYALVLQGLGPCRRGRR